MSCSWCGLKRREEKTNKFSWKFSNGTTVYADTIEDAVDYMNSIVNSKNFWASETIQGMWDVQLSNNVIVHDISAETVMDAVKIARWKMNLDSSFKKINSYY